MGRLSKIDTVIGGHLRIGRRALWGRGATTSTTYELVRPGAMAGKCRFSLGSLKEPVQDESDLVRFWQTALFRMKRHGLDERQRRHVAGEMVRRGARQPIETTPSP